MRKASASTLTDAFVRVAAHSLSSVEPAPSLEVCGGYQVLDDTTLLADMDRISGRGESDSDLPPRGQAKIPTSALALPERRRARRAAEQST